MKKFLSVVLLATTIVFTLSAQQARRVYITLDVSESMKRDRYTLANYSAQMIATLCDPQDEVNLIICGNLIPLSKGSNQLKVIQYPIIHFPYSHYDITQFGDIIGFNHLYSPSSNSQDWLFIIGDGDWGTYKKQFDNERELFKSIVNNNQLNVCFLQTGDNDTQESSFLQYLKTIGTVDIKMVSIQTQSIKDGCDFFAKKILGFSDIPLNIESPDVNRIAFRSELPLSEFIVVYQDDVQSKDLPSLISVSVKGTSLDYSLRGTPTTTPVRGPNDAVLSGNVWTIQSNQFISAGDTINLEFNNPVSAENISIFPIVKGSASSGVMTIAGLPLKNDGNYFSVCDYETSAVVIVGPNEISLQNGNSRTSIPESLLEKTSVVIKANNRSYPAIFKEGSFKAEIDLPEDETHYYAEIDCAGYFRWVTTITSIKKVPCEKARTDTAPDTTPEQEPAPKPIDNPLLKLSVTFDQLQNDVIRLVINDAETLEMLDPDNFDVIMKVKEDYLFDEPQIQVQDSLLVVTLHPIGNWCECLFPMDINITVSSSQKAGAFDVTGKRYGDMNQPIQLTVIKSRNWLSRCMWVIITLVILLLFFIYLRSLMKKKRFKKDARIASIYYDYYGFPVSGTGGRYLRKQGFGAWLARWFSPRDERVILSWSKPAVSSFTLVASDSKEIVNIPKRSFPASTMSLPGYDPEDEDSKQRFIQWADGETINVSQRGGGKDGELTFISGEEDDGAKYRLFLGILCLLSVISMFVLLFLMIIRSL